MVDLPGDVVRDRASRLIAESAQRAFAALPGAPDALAPGQPVLVRTPSGEAAYWLVGGHTAAGVRALARVLLDGRVATVGVTRAPVEDPAAAATGLSEREAGLWQPPGATDQPTLVCDGPVGREAWLHVVPAGEPTRWIFATGGGEYERGAGEPPRGGVID